MKRSVVSVIVGLLVLLLAGGAFVWWKISGLKEALVRDFGNALGAQVEVSSLNLDPWKCQLRAAGISLINLRPSAPWEKGEISQATVSFHLRDLFAPTLPLKVEVSSWSVVLHPAAAETPETPDAEAAPAESAAPTTKGRVQVTQLSADGGSVEIDLSQGRNVVLQGVAFQSSDNGAAGWTTELQASSIVAEPLEAGPSSVHIRADPNGINFSDLRLQCNQGFITGEGDVAMAAPHQAHASLQVTQIPLSMLVAMAWKMKLSGVVTGDLHYEGNDQGSSAKGQLAVDHGKFSVLPWLTQVTSLVGLPDISNLELDKATTDYIWTNGALSLTNVDVRKNDVIRVAGSVDVGATGLIVGRLQVGLPSTVTDKWPALEQGIFTLQREDYNWTNVVVTGTPDHLHEDLTPRLVALGLQQGGDILNTTSQKAMDLFNSFMGK